MFFLFISNGTSELYLSISKDIFVSKGHTTCLLVSCSTRMEMIKDGWFHEVNKFWPGQCMSLEIEEILFHEKSKYQDVLVFQSTNHGKVLVLDGVIQCTDRDEFAYQEMIAHLPLCSHKNPEKVLVIGGGDGGVVREVLKHSCVKSVVQCEIDQLVIDICKMHFPNMTCEYDNPKLTQYVGDGFKFMEENPNTFDVIITDSSDPEGPAEALFERPYFKLMKRALKPGGVVCSQGECMWLHLKLIKEMMSFCSSIFPVVDYAYTTIPTYPSGQIGFLLCGSSKETSFRDPIHSLKDDKVKEMGLKYYNSSIHRASFILPEFANEALSMK